MTVVFASMYDAIVVGGRVAGAPTAMLLARKGYKVLVVDQATFPSDTISTHHIHRAGLATANRWGLLARLVATGGPRIRRWTFDVGPFAITGNPLPAGDIDFDLCPRRTVLDKTLLDAAADAGAEVREGFAVTGILADGDRVCGIQGQTADGRGIQERAHMVVGADGRRSRIARLVDAPVYNDRPALSFGYYSYWSGVDLRGVNLYPRDGCGIVAEETNDGLAYVAVGWRREQFSRVRGDVEHELLSTLRTCAPTLYDQVAHAERVAPFKGADFPFFFRKPYGEGWALVGDAGYHRDAITGQGITDAFRDADLLAHAIDAGLSGAEPMQLAMVCYERARNAAVMPMYEFTYKLAKMEPPTPEEAQLFGALRENPAEAERFLSTIAGTVPVAEFFADANVGRILGGTAVAA
jgi:2-polyprenyl-6-methoxyphenol hydroxylase-like FAD-dependent oxidoreductase